MKEKMVQTSIPKIWVDTEGRLFEEVDGKFYASIYGGAEPGDAGFQDELDDVLGVPSPQGDPRDPPPDEIPDGPVGDNEHLFQDDDGEEEDQVTPEEDDETLPPAAEGDSEEGEDEDENDEEGEPIAAEGEPDFGDAPLTEREKWLVSRINELSGRGMDSNQPVQPQEQQLQFEPIDFVGEQDIDDILETKESFNAFLQKVYEAGARASASIVSQQVPQQVSSTVTRANAMRELVEDFYGENEDLNEMRHTVAMVAQEIIKETPDVPMEDLMNQAAVRTRKMLGLPPKTKASSGNNGRTRTTGKTKKPAFAGNNRGRRKTPRDQRTETEKEIAELIDF